MIDNAYTRTNNLLTERKAQVELLAEALLEKEVLFQSDVELLIGKRPFEEKKLLDVVDLEDTPAEAKVIATPRIEENKSINEQEGTIGLAPSI